MKTLKTILSKTSYITLSLVVGLTLAAGITFAAWTATWHGTDWINSGETISAQKIAENFEYLYTRAGDLPTSCPVGEVIVSTGSGWECGASGGGAVTCSDPTELLIGDTHTVADCTSVGGTAVSIVDGCLCKVSGSSCSSGWTKLNNWSSTFSRQCIGSGSAPCGGYAQSCTTGSHVFDNRSTESCIAIDSGLDSGGTQCVTARSTCYATITEVGCI